MYSEDKHDEHGDSSSFSFTIGLYIGNVTSVVVVYRSSARVKQPFISIQRWRGQEGSLHEEEVPSQVLYDKLGKLLACGAEVSRSDQNLQPREQYDADYTVKHFAQYLDTSSLAPSVHPTAPALPPGVDIRSVYSDFINYLLCHTRQYLAEYTGSDPWSSSNEIDVVLTHPSWWGAAQKTTILKATNAALALHRGPGVRLHLVAENAAMVSFSLSSKPSIVANVTAGAQIIICDADDLTTDISSYRVSSFDNGAISLHETYPSSRVMVGPSAIYATLHERIYSLLQESSQEHEWKKLSDQEASPEALRALSDCGVRDFRSRARQQIQFSSAPCDIRLGSSDLDVRSPRVHNGVISLSGVELDCIHKPTVEPIIEAITQYRGSDRNPVTILISQDLGTNPYVRYELQKHFGERSVRPLDLAKPKAVAIGGLTTFLNNDVKIKRCTPRSKSRIHRAGHLIPKLWQAAHSYARQVQSLW